LLSVVLSNLQPFRDEETDAVVVAIIDDCCGVEGVDGPVAHAVVFVVVNVAPLP
jgi:hypothetical protein